MASLTRGRSFVESLVGDNSTLKNLFTGNNKSKKEIEDPSKWIKELSSLANTVVGRCCRILMLEPEELQQQFDKEVSENAAHPSCYAQNLLEYGCFKALSVATRDAKEVSDLLRDKEFQRLVFDMMLAWEAPGAAHKAAEKSEHGEGDKAEDDDEDPALFYSDLMPMMVDVETAVGQEAFARLAPLIPLVADTISAYHQFEALTSSTGGRLPFPIFEKYLNELDKSVKNIRSQSASLVSSLKLGGKPFGEKVVEVDGTATTQPVLQHMGVSTWPGRLTLTTHALYFEPAGVVSYDKAKKFDLSADLRHVVKPDLTGPWGARLFDKAVMYKSTATTEPIVLEFPELTGRSRRDYWLTIIREIVSVHNFNRGYRLESIGRFDALAKAVWGIARLRATKECFHSLPPRPESLLTFSNADTMPAGDIVLKALAGQLPVDRLSYPGELLFGKQDMGRAYSPTSVSNAGSPTVKGNAVVNEDAVAVGEILIGEPTPLQVAVLHSRDNSKKVELARATIDGVKLDGIGTNIAVLKELLLPFATFSKWMHALYYWEDSVKSIAFTLISSYIIYRNWLPYVIPLILLSAAGYMFSLRRNAKGGGSDEVVVATPPPQTTVEQLLALQQGLAQLEGLLQSGNIGLLKIRALFSSVLPEPHSQTMNHIIIGMAIASVCLATLPFRVIFLILFVETFTRNCQVRIETTKRWIRRLKEWWYIVPAVSVRFVDHDSEEDQ